MANISVTIVGYDPQVRTAILANCSLVCRQVELYVNFFAFSFEIAAMKVKNILQKDTGFGAIFENTYLSKFTTFSKELILMIL